jgi:hypothetical protein
MAKIQTSGLLLEIQQHVRWKGPLTISWRTIEAFLAPMKVKDAPEVIADWAASYMIAVDYTRENDQPNGPIVSAYFSMAK